MLKYIVVIILLILVFFTYPIIKNYISTHKNIEKLNWTQVFDLKDLNTDYVAQGITTDGEFIYYSVHEKDRQSILLIFKEKDDKLTLQTEFILPPEATHTSDLTYFEGLLYSIDYASSSIYVIDIKKSIKENKLNILNKIQTPIKRSGSLEIVLHNNKLYLLITSFLNDNNMYVYDFQKFFKNELEKPLFKIKTSYFTQGLFFDRHSNYLYQSVNKQGQDFIYKIDINTLFTSKDLQKAILNVYDTPADLIEDIVIKDDYLYTSEEKTNKIYKAKI